MSIEEYKGPEKKSGKNMLQILAFVGFVSLVVASFFLNPSEMLNNNQQNFDEEQEEQPSFDPNFHADSVPVKEFQEKPDFQ